MALPIPPRRLAATSPGRSTQRAGFWTLFARGSLPIVYTTTAYAKDMHDAGVFAKKVPSLAILQKGSSLVEVDQRIQPLPGERIVEKKYASSFFGTNLDVELRALGVDTVIMAGCTTSGCIRASAINSLQYGFTTIVVRQAVGDRADGPHQANLFDIDAKYGDVVDLAEALDYLDIVRHAPRNSPPKHKTISTSGGRARQARPER